MPIHSAQLPSSIVNVAVAVIHYQEQYLLGFRNTAQHQGNRYEFVGGKIDPDEAAIDALIREVGEEIGINISNNVAVKLGRLHHDYGDKQVCLQVYKVALTGLQFEQHGHRQYGLEGQALSWVSKSQLLAGDYPLPAANQTILAWLQLPEQLIITYPLAHFIENPNASEAWLTYHQQHLPQGAWVYVRTKANAIKAISQQLEVQLAKQLMDFRPDIDCVLPNNIGQTLIASKQDKHLSCYQANQQLKACHLTHTELMDWFTGATNGLECSQKNPECLSADQPLLISCHDADSIHAANQLAAARLQQQQPPVIGIFLSPVLATQTHPNDVPLGWDKWSSLAQIADMPVIALGGLSPMMVQQATQYGATSIAGIRQFMQS
ncbi:NUDIX domain-containing protein [Psychrobacter frigidicola]|uniref:8-oxo-dGTP diphosphatase n=1 Tax=Psychrobacter frigidicola TaxID=45611 RepID=A0A5C7A481_9GAMM|nr:NUDIX domain-containing protein [Psychrobacter frigidicola]TXD98231.1 NUDIX domain-containing protein [Psychrobacter frigidicola]